MYGNTPPTKGEIFQNVLCGLGIFLVIITFVGGCIFSGAWAAQHNNEKVRQMTVYCVSHGYSGWSDSGDRGTIGCVGGRGNNS